MSSSPPAKKKRKIKSSTTGNRRNVPSSVKTDQKARTPLPNSLIPTIPVGRIDLKVHYEKKNAVAQAELEGCLGNFRSFDSTFGNHLVPVVPTLADLSG